MDLYKICDDFVNGKIEINDVIKKYKINYFIFVKFIKRYCAYYKIIIDDKLQARLNIPLKEMYELKKECMPYEELAKKYNCNANTIKRKLKEYCKGHNLELHERILRIEKIKLSIKEIYELKKGGMTYKELSKKYDCNVAIINQSLKEYCKENNLELPQPSPSPKKLKLPVEEIYEFKKSGMTYKELAKKYNCNITTIRKKLEKYCEEQDLVITKINYKSKKLKLPIEEIYELRKQEMTYKELAEKYDCSHEAIRKKLIKYCKEQNKEFLKRTSGIKRIELPMKKVYELKKSGVTYKELSEKYNCNVTTINQSLKEYCKERSLELPKTSPGPKKLELPIEEIYELKKEGMSLRILAEKYNCRDETIRRRVLEYEEQIVLRNKYLEIFLYDINKIKDNILNEKKDSFYTDNEIKKQEIKRFIKR